MNTPAAPERVMRVGPGTSTQELGGAISAAIYNSERVVLRAIGAGAVNQAVKGIITAQSYVSQRGLTLVNRPGFATVELKGEERTAVVFHVFTI